MRMSTTPSRAAGPEASSKASPVAMRVFTTAYHKPTRNCRVPHYAKLKLKIEIEIKEPPKAEARDRRGHWERPRAKGKHRITGPGAAPTEANHEATTRAQTKKQDRPCLTGVLTDFVELKKLLPPSVASNQDPGVPHTLSIQAMGIAYVLTGTWSASQMLQYTNTVLKIAASDGWAVAVHYDAVVRKRWVARSLAESWAKLPGEQTALDRQSLDQARGLSRRRGGQTGGQTATRAPQRRDIAMKEGLCICFSKDGQRGCPKLAGACKYHH
ncbi:hypothetical protein FOL47_010176, partial [Perkinsus chesapeaki]